MTPIVKEQKLMGFLAGDWKYVMTPWGSEEKLFDLKEDPDETINVALERPELAVRMRTRLEEIVATMSSNENERRIELDEQAKKTLRSLGYVQ